MIYNAYRVLWYNKMIKWNLESIIIGYGIKRSDLAIRLNVTVGAITNLVNDRDTMPKIDGNRLNKLLIAINDCLRSMNNPTVIKLYDLIEWIPDEIE